MTTKLWANELAKEKQRKISAKLKKLLKPKAMERANKDVEMAIEGMDTNATSDALISVICKEAKEAVGQEVQVLKRHVRKKSLGDGKTHPSTPKKNGRESNANSKSSRSRSRSRSSTSSRKGKQEKEQPKKEQPKQKKKKPKSALKESVKFKRGTKKGAPTKPNASKATQGGRGGRGGRGGVSNGGKGRSASER